METTTGSEAGADATFEVIVAGAGLAGLAAAAAAARAGRRVLVVDGHPAGGRARTDDRRGFKFNLGAHGLYRGGHAQRVLGELGIEWPSGGSPSTAVWGRAGEAVSPLPVSPSGVFRSRLLSTAAKARLGRAVWTIRSLDPGALADRSAEAWLAGLGLPHDATQILRALAHVASYADDLGAISADAVAGQLRAVIRHGVRYLDGGWQVLVDALLATATGHGAEVRVGSAVAGVEGGARPAGDGSNDNGSLTVRLADGSTFRAGTVVLAVGGPEATAALLPRSPSWAPVGPPSTAACLDLGLRRLPPKRALFGVGEPLYLSTHTPAADLAPAGGAVVHLMRYGARDAATDRAELWAHARRAGIGDDDVIESRFLARMVTNPAVPVPGSGLAGRPAVDSSGVPGVLVAGDWVGPHGLLADASLASGQAAGTRAAALAAVAAPSPASPSPA